MIKFVNDVYQKQQQIVTFKSLNLGDFFVTKMELDIAGELNPQELYILIKTGEKGALALNSESPKYSQYDINLADLVVKIDLEVSQVTFSEEDGINDET